MGETGQIINFWSKTNVIPFRIAVACNIYVYCQLFIKHYLRFPKK